MPTWTDALRHFIEQVDGLGILVMCNGVVHNNNYRHLDPQEFRGFAMADDLAPLVGTVSFSSPALPSCRR
jgi:hypothetical protein